MKIYKGQYGWKTTAHTKDVNGEDIKCYPDVQFKKGCEPIEKEIEGRLFFRSDDGSERECFLSSYKKNDGTIVPKIVVLEVRYPSVKKMQVERKEQQPGEDHMVKDVTIDPDELPFY